MSLEFFEDKDTRYLESEGYRILEDNSGIYNCKVLKVSKKDKVTTIKYPLFAASYIWDTDADVHWRISYRSKLKHITRESETLDILKDLEGVVSKIRDFEIPIPDYRFFAGLGIRDAWKNRHHRFASAIEKEYIEGKRLGGERSEKIKIKGKRNQKFLKKTVYAAHKLGISCLDLTPDNILIDNSGTPYLFDFGTAIIRGKDSKEKFDREVKWDLKLLEETIE